MGRKAKEKTSQSLEEIEEYLNKTYGKGTIISLDEKQEGEYEIISSGSIGMDWRVLGVGGFIKGKLYEIRGWEGSGKSTVVGQAAANCQKKGGTVLYIDGEHALDKKYFKALGVDTKSLKLCQPDYGESGFDVAERMITSGEIDLAIIDSDSSLLPKCIIENPMEASNLGKKAFLNSKVYPRIKIALDKAKCCVIVISQYREKIGVMFGDPKVTQGGHALKYTADTIIELSKRLVKEGEETLANDTKVKTIKNKTHPPYKESRFNIVFGKGIDTIDELINLSSEYNILQKSGAWYSKDGDNIAQGYDGMRQFLDDNEEFTEALKEELIEAIKSNKNEENND